MSAEISVVVCGARGKMGQTVVAAVAAQPDMSVVAEVDLGDDLVAALGSGAVVMVENVFRELALRHDKEYDLVDVIRWSGAKYRRDIGHRAIQRETARRPGISHGGLGDSDALRGR